MSNARITRIKRPERRFQSLLSERYLTVVIAVTIVMVVQVTFDEIAGVVAMRHSFVTAIFTVHVTIFVTFARMTIAIQRMLVNVVTMLVMEVTIMQIISVVAMLNSSMSAAR